MSACPDQAGLRRIIHIDMDAFYASVEQRDNPELRGKPVAVGGKRARGVVAAASYEARVFGVRSAMPSTRALRLCPDLIFLPARFDVYRQVSQLIRGIFHDYTPLVEPLSLDEAYLDVTDHLQGRSATGIAEEIRARIFKSTFRLGRGLTASAGVSYNKFLAKLASDQRKPDGLFVITPKAGPDFVAGLPVARFHGVGPATAARMAALGIQSGADLRQWSEADLSRHFGKAGSHYYRISRGVDDRKVTPDRKRKSLGAETTYSENIHDPAEAKQRLLVLACRVWEMAQKDTLAGRSVTIKARYGDFQTYTRSHTRRTAFDTFEEFGAQATAMLAEFLPDPRGLRLLGVTLSVFEAQEASDDHPEQLKLL